MTASVLLRHLGGPSAVTWWTVLLPLPLLLALRWLALDLDDESLRLPYLLATVAGQVLVGIGAWVAWSTVLRPTGRGSRPVTAVAVFASLGVLRIAGVGAVELGLGLPLSRPLPQEFAIGALQGVVVLGVISVIVNAHREYRAGRDALADVHERIRVAESLDNARVRELSAVMLAETARQVVERIEQGPAGQPADAQAAAQALRDIAEQYVRPLSHRIEQLWSVALLPELMTQTPVTSPPTRLERMRAATREAASSLQPPPPVVATILMALVATPTLLRVYGTTATGVILGVAVPILLGGTWATGATMRRAQGRPMVLVPVLGLGVLGTAAASVVADEAAYAAFTGEQARFTATVATFTFIALGLAAIATMIHLQTRYRDALAASVAQEALIGERIAQRLTGVRRAVTHFLHSSVQGELVATALMLQRAEPGGIDVPRAVSAVSERVLAGVLATAETATDEVRPRLESQLAFWQSAAGVESTVDEHCWARLDGDPELAETFRRVISEALTNAVRHGVGGPITLLATATGADIDVLVTSMGTIRDDDLHAPSRSSARPGIGLDEVARLAASWSLTESSGRVVLQARLES